MLRYIVSIVLLLSALAGSAQFNPKPTGIRFGTDLTNIGYSLFSNNWTQYEFHVDVDVANFFIVADYGVYDRTWSEANYSYTSQGSYYRVGFDHNFFNKKPGNDVFFVGFRYGASNYKDEMSYIIQDNYWGEVANTDKNENLKASWIEAVLGLKVQIWKELYLGMTGRLKLAPSISGEEELISFEIPGYGRASRTSYWGFNYHIFWRIPFSKNEAPVRGAD